ncbi:2-amino-4-hydroxy-6-hydroxymethyldihydropteridine diphosphokinase [Spongiibacter sp. KMU-158]|uniref:2-amino-4-hydroxy-6-hydroxymethyldihydropteridine pyrophosphokinase n=1 Tax=Spongiibacter pelagi TaxID=2760804 RepID=A0A927C5M0_9GAMM|nr:2-amino-4-hydroxy-6-hydroxymethyldihydropteridine diphosphokinase [Spongiibacter pelagi]MBD2860006.1 2-amino-4-hydroxy-6-hydroxymethyldihydropteridine diphosphokinase [Spongiibacter pelagi]
MTRCFIGLGSNLENPRQQITAAIAALATLPHTQLSAQSQLYGSKAIGPGLQGDYVNAVAELHTELDALGLLSELQKLEAQFGRQRLIHWGPRTLDLDLLLFGEEHRETPELSLPHPRMWERDFVLFPLGELAPELLTARGLDHYTDSGNMNTQQLWLLDTPIS